jgi:hypothetical protein
LFINVELYEKVVFRLFNDTDSTVQIMFRRTRNGISVHVQMKSIGNIIPDSAFMIDILTGIDII